jgi:mRNA interferase RelE/StbE
VKRILWTDDAKADVRALSKPIAMQILSGLHRFAESGEGDVKALRGRKELRLRIGDYRLFFVHPDPEGLEIRRVFSPKRGLPFMICCAVT